MTSTGGGGGPMRIETWACATVQAIPRPKNALRTDFLMIICVSPSYVPNLKTLFFLQSCARVTSRLGKRQERIAHDRRCGLNDFGAIGRRVRIKGRRRGK